MRWAREKRRNEYSLLATAMADYSPGHAAESQRALDRVIKQRNLQVAYQIAGVYA